MKRTGLLLGLCLAILLAVPQVVCAFQTHYFNCNVCHKPEFTTSQLGSGNVCLSCHEYNAGGSASLNNVSRGTVPPTGLNSTTDGLFIETLLLNLFFAGALKAIHPSAELFTATAALMPLELLSEVRASFGRLPPELGARANSLIATLICLNQGTAQP